MFAILPPVLGQDMSAKSPDEIAGLFNGRNLGGFYTYLEHSKYEDPKRVFTIQGGLLRISGEEWGGVVTKDSYRDYHLVVEWKWGAPDCGGTI